MRPKLLSRGAHKSLDSAIPGFPVHFLISAAKSSGIVIESTDIIKLGTYTQLNRAPRQSKNPYLVSHFTPKFFKFN